MTIRDSVASVNALILRRQRWVKVVVFIAALLPFLLLLYALLTGQLGPNPIDALTDKTGTLAIRMLVISLALSPLRWLLKTSWPLQYRRMLGLFAFFYGALHVCTYFVLDQQLDLMAIWNDLSERPYIIAGTIAFVLMIPLAMTSTKKMIRRLGKRWSSLHRSVYLVGMAAVVHYVWLAKGDLIEPFVYLGIVILLFAHRLVKSISD